MIPKIKKVSLSMQLIETMVELIENETWALGEKLPNELELAASFNVSRNIMREAMKIIESFGILDSKTGIGTYVSMNALSNIHNMHFFSALKNNTSVEKLLETRLIIEPELVYYATLRATDEELKILGNIIQSEIEKDNSPFFYTQDLEFHTLIGKYSRNEILANLLSSILEQLTSSDYSSFNQHTDKTTIITSRTDHTLIYDAMIKKDALLARDIIYNHLFSRIEAINSSYSTDMALSQNIQTNRIATQKK